MALPLLVANDQVRIYFFHFLGYQAELLYACRINLFLVAEGNRFKRQNALRWLCPSV